MKKRALSLLFLTVILISTAVYAQSKAASVSPNTFFTIDGEKVSMEDMLRMLLKKSYDLQSNRYDASMADSDYQKYQQMYSPYLSVEAGTGHEWYSDTLAPAYGEEQSKWDATVAVSKYFDTGTTVTGGLQNTYTNVIDRDGVYAPLSDSNGNLYGTGYAYPLITEGGVTNVPAVFFKVEQELLKNSFGINDRKTEAMLKSGAMAQREMMKYQISGTAANLISQLWSLSYLKQTNANDRINLNESIKLRNIISENVKLGLSESFQKNYYNALVESARSSLAQSNHELASARRDIKTMLNLGEDIEIGETIDFVTKLPQIDTEALIEQALAKRPDYIAAQVQLKIARNQIDIADNGALPELVGSAEVQSYGTADSLGESLGGALTVSDSYGYDLRLKMTYPLSNPQQKTEARDAELSYRQAELNLEKTERQIRDDILTKIDAVKTAYTVYTRSRNMRQEYQAYYNKMRANLRRGRFTAAEVKQGLDAYIGGRKGEITTLVYYNLALVQLDIATNSLFEHYGIDLEQYLQNGMK
jgi:outer membrane protein TolC